MMIQELEDVVIVGAGLTGLVAGIALSRCGAMVRIFEKATSLSESGAGIWVPPNAMRVLAFLGISDEVKKSGIEIRSAELHDYRAGLLQDIDTKSSDGLVNVAIHRQSLQRILAEHIPSGVIHFGKELAELAQGADGVSLQFSNSMSVHARMVLGADGIRSAVRRCLFPKAQLRYSDQSSWRAVLPATLSSESNAKSFEFWAPGMRFGYSAISRDWVYWYATADTPVWRNESPKQTKKRLVRMAELFPQPVPEFVSKTLDTTIIYTDLWDLPGLKTWHTGRVILLGDAAHAATPNLGQGAAQGFEDAWILVECLTHHSDLSAAFVDFEGRRLARSETLMNRAWQLGRVAHLSGLPRLLRNSAMKATPNWVISRQMNELYEYMT